MDNPVRFAPLIVHLDRAISGADGEIRIGIMQLYEVPDDCFLSVTQRDDEFVESIKGVMSHDMPEDRFTADLHHGFWALIRFLGQPRAHPTRKKRNFHSAVQDA